MSEPEQHRFRTRPVLALLAVLLVVAGAVALIVGIRAQQHPPQPPASAAIPFGQSSAASSASPSASSGASSKAAKPGLAVKGPVLKAATPTHLDIPAIGVSSNLLQLGLNPDRSVQVPPLDRDSKAGWYRYSPTPGQLGPSVILGHVDSAEYGPGVFFRLGALRPGDQLSIARSDHTVAIFRIDRVVAYPKAHFPTYDVYGNTDHAALRLITCGGKFDFSTHNYESNIVAYASLISSHSA
ncbi:MAG: class F sortase [Jatrophihabitantaceae bacterium]